MAATSLRASPRQLSLTDSSLPHGPCNFRDLNVGRDTGTCGCRRFWLNDLGLSTLGQDDGGRAQKQAMCFCGHHACFHDEASFQSTLAAASGQQDVPFGRAVSNRPDSRRSKASMQRPETPRAIQSSKVSDTGLGLLLAEGRAQSSPSRAMWNLRGFSDNNSNLPSTQQASTAPSIAAVPAFQAPIVAPNADSQRSRMASVPQLDFTNMSPRYPHPQELDMNQSVTEVATPSVTGTPALRGLEMTSGHWDAAQNFHTSPSIHASNRQRDSKALSNNGDLASHFESLRANVLETRAFLHSLGSRLDTIESLSFSHATVDGLSEQMELFDGRMTELEGQVDDLERFRKFMETDNDRDTPHLNGPKSNASFRSSASRASDDNTLEAAQQLQAEAAERLSELEDRLFTLESSAGPTTTQPWEVEVVFVPWGKELKGLWGLPTDTFQTSESTMQDSQSASRHAVEQTHPGRADWLYARACAATSGTGGRIFERLRSRGFVKTILLTNRHAHALETAINVAFADVLVLFRSARPANSVLGLHSAFVPLRKVHKSSRLEYLSEAELATPVNWTADFLEASVFMKQPSLGRRRLFVTYPQAYLQHDAGTTWQRLRELPRVDVASGSSAAASNVGEADAREECWVWDVRLDPPQSTNSSFASSLASKQLGGSFASSHPLSPEESAYEPSDNFNFGGADSNEEMEHEHPELCAVTLRRQRSDGPAPITPISEFPASSSAPLMAPAMRRTTSLPTQSAEPQASMSKRQVASFEQQSASPPKIHPKRRKMSISDEHEYAGAGPRDLTPRRSREPPSPGRRTYEDRASSGRRSSSTGTNVQAATETKRGVTPQAYATPFSNSVPAFISLGPEDGGDTDMDESSDEESSSSSSDMESEYDEDRSLSAEFDQAMMRDEEAWEGVGDAEMDDRESEYGQEEV